MQETKRNRRKGGRIKPTPSTSFFGSSWNEGEWSWKRNREKIAGEGENELTPLALPHSLAVRGMEESERGRETY
jgi:hypothetical protein